MSERPVIGWVLDDRERTELLMQFPPTYPRIVARHVTLKVGATGPLPEPKTGVIIGRVDDGRGVEALVVAIDGSTERPGGGHFHITWSLEEGREARESNDAIAALGWTAIEPDMPVELHPARVR